MPLGDLEAFEALVGDVLEGVGYDCALATISDTIGGQADAWRDAWLAELAQREGFDSGAHALAATRRGEAALDAS